MFVILTYDAGKSRNRKLLKICRKYLTHTQESVFEGNLTEAKLKQLEAEIKNTLYFRDDSCQIYLLENTKYCTKHCIGKTISSDEILIRT